MLDIDCLTERCRCCFYIALDCGNLPSSRSPFILVPIIDLKLLPPLLQDTRGWLAGLTLHHYPFAHSCSVTQFLKREPVDAMGREMAGVAKLKDKVLPQRRVADNVVVA
jgi:hypothetical protein